ncbi:hypothetical protein BX600DRAFT_429887 [Xylariales sp. PMI_506]|nr:hypothetical protein BX600DRAFT_429887 [Xylariales sp. PMI_506]
MAASKGIVMITGATGYIGSAVLVGALKAGYKAHVVVRDASKIETVTSAPAVQAVLSEPSNIKFFTVSDLSVPGSLDEATAGADYVIHVAAWLMHSVPSTVEEQAEALAQGDKVALEALESAKRAGTVKRVVCTSSVAAFATPELIISLGELTQDAHVGEDTMNEYDEPPFDNPVAMYCALKTSTLRRSIEWVERHHRAAAAAEGAPALGFDLVNVAPPYVFGPHPLAYRPGDEKKLLFGSNRKILRCVVPDQSSELREAAVGAHIDEVVAVHIGSLDKDRVPTPAATGWQNFVFGVGFKWEDVNPLIAKLWPDQVASGLLDIKATFKTQERISYDYEKVEKIFGFKAKSFEDLVRASVGQYVELAESGSKSETANVSNGQESK